MSLCLVLVLAVAPAAALKQSPPPAVPEDVLHSLEMIGAAIAPPPKMFHIIPKNGFVCLEGTQDYLQNEVLVRLQASNMQTGWMTSKVEEGTCDSASYWEGPNPEGCFPESTLWKNMDHIHETDKMDMIFINEYNEQHPELTPAKSAVVQCMAAPMFHMFPKNSSWCYEGAKDDLLFSLKRFKKSNIRSGWTTSFPVPGTCASASHTTGPYADDCFPKVQVWMDMKGKAKLLEEGVFFKLVGLYAGYVAEYNDEHKDWVDKMPNVECLGEKYHAPSLQEQETESNTKYGLHVSDERDEWFDTKA